MTKPNVFKVTPVPDESRLFLNECVRCGEPPFREGALVELPGAPPGLYHAAVDDCVTALRKRLESVRGVLENLLETGVEVVEDLEAELGTRYRVHEGVPEHEYNLRRYQRDMDAVIDFRSAMRTAQELVNS
jgi:hypothetical protein